MINETANYTLNLNLSSLVSGGKIVQSVRVGVFDQDNQLVNIDSQSQALMLSTDVKLQISGNNKKTAKNGIYEFDSITFLAEPMYLT